MEYRLEIHRQISPDDNAYIQTIAYSSDDDSATVATALMDINSCEDIRDVDGNHVTAIIWEHSCNQRKCGACAMVINGVPRLACDSKLREVADRNSTIRLEPLRKFPLVADLMVDRSIMRDNLRDIQAWLRNAAEAADERTIDTAFEASRCLQCGCCLEVCPNYYSGGRFYGMASMAPVSRLIAEMSKEDRKQLLDMYRKKIYEGCGKSMACRDICPAHIDIEKLLARSNAAALWKLL